MSRNAYSLIALPDFPEFAQAVRYGVPETPKQLGIVSPVLRGKYRTEEPRKNRGAGPPLSVHLFEVKNAELTLTFAGVRADENPHGNRAGARLRCGRVANDSPPDAHRTGGSS